MPVHSLLQGRPRVVAPSGAGYPGQMLESGLTRRAWHCLQRRWSVLLLVGGASFWGCGGRAALEAEEEATGVAGQSGAGIAAAGSGGTPGGPVVELDDPSAYGTSMVLGPCVLGFRQSSARGRECTFVHERRCYEDDLAACACACPMGGQCVIGRYLNPEGPFPVTCSLQ